ncbi:hypothetical protein DPMN_190808 [Dreissena polymorpha]|uniref:Uncharacterized protein n=1 Tax=Dreissena polymorpha TaxID=45954 RepID=A0A9D3Y0U8_DREPO|nr:hypothetical protein DPMN_190808 [Dreissena polymorpha]
MKGAEKNTQAQIATVEQKVAATQSNTHTLQSRFQSMDGTQGVLKKKRQGLSNHKSMQKEYRRIETLKKTQSDMKGDAIKIHAQRATFEQKVAAMQSNAYNLQSRVQSLEGTQ